MSEHHVAMKRMGCCAGWPKPCSYHEGYRDAYESQQDEVETLRRSLLEAVRTVLLTTEIIAPDIDLGRFPIYAKQLQAFYDTDPAALALASVPEGYTRPPGTCVCNCHLDHSECCETCAPEEDPFDAEFFHAE